MLRVWCSFEEINFDDSFLSVTMDNSKESVDRVRTALAHELGHCTNRALNGGSLRNQELRADEEGLRIWHKMGYDVNKYLEALKEMQSDDKVHPSGINRYKNALKFYNELKAKEDSNGHKT